MIDIHCHILPGLDDGAADIYDTLEMALMAATSGVKAIVATPHCRTYLTVLMKSSILT